MDFNSSKEWFEPWETGLLGYVLAGYTLHVALLPSAANSHFARLAVAFGWIQTALAEFITQFFSLVINVLAPFHNEIV